MTLIIATIAAFANIFVGLFAYLESPRSATHIAFFGLSVSLAAWLVINDIAVHATEHGPALVLTRIVMLLAVGQAASFLLLSFSYPGSQIRMSRRRLTVYLAAAALVMAIAISPFLFTDVVLEKGNVSPQPGPGMAAFLVFAIPSVVYGLFRLLRQFRQAKGLARMQLTYLLAGALSMFTALIIFNVVFVLILKSSALTSLGAFSTLFFTGAVAYAIVRHHLLDIRPIVARSVAYTLTVAILLATYTALVFGVSQMIYGGQMETGRSLINAVLALFVAATFQPLKVKLEKATNRIFYKGGYDSDELAGSITAVMAETFKLEELATQSLEKLVNTMNITNGTFWVIDKETFTNVACAGHKTPPRYQHDDLMKLSQSDHLMVFEEDTDSHQGVLRHMNITVAMPLFAGEVLQGLILLGPKKSGDVYTDKDLNLLRILGPSMATALENARSYRQISEFNVTLSHEVEKATEQLRQANDQLTRKNKQLEELDKLKDEFISVTSHELRTPLTAIRGYLWMVLNNRDQASFKTYLDRAYVSSERLIDLVNDTLDISRIESGRVQLDPQPTKLPSLARQVATELEPRARERNQKLTVRQAPNLPAAYCDTDKLHQVMTNLIGNALKFTPERGTISVHFYVDGKQVVTAISDNGPGISPENQKKLFQKFSRVGNTGDVPGTGLGLYLCQQIVELSKGKIWVDSTEGEGATFFFSLPISKEQPSILVDHKGAAFRKPAAAK